VGIDPGPILIEPEAKNTAAAILAAPKDRAQDIKKAVELLKANFRCYS
jgi:mannose-1-phosphate guanylyltransferase